jgi:hypothetical protein
MKRAWKHWTELFEAEGDPSEPHFDPVHLAVVLVATQVVIGALYWLLWTLFVYEGGLPSKVGRLLAGRAPGEGFLANVAALAMAAFLVVLLRKAERAKR